MIIRCSGRHGESYIMTRKNQERTTIMSIAHSTTRDQALKHPFIEDFVRETYLKDQTCSTRAELCRKARSLAVKYNQEKKENKPGQYETLEKYRDHGVSVRDCKLIETFHVRDCRRQGFASNGSRNQKNHPIAIGGESGFPTEGDEWFVLVLQADGSVACFGNNTHGQAPPEGIPADPENPFISVSAGRTHSLALRKDGSIACRGKFGLVNSDTPPLPNHIEPESPDNKYIAIAAGTVNHFVLALREDGSVVRFDENMNEERKEAESAENPFVAVAAWTHYLALRKDGSFFSFDVQDYHGHTRPHDFKPPPNQTYVVLSTRRDVTIALCNNQTDVVGYSAMLFRGRQTDAPKNLSPIVSISAGQLHGLYLHADGSISCNPNNAYGEAPPEGVPANPNDPFVAIAAGPYISIALHKSGKLYVFGNVADELRMQLEAFTQ